MRRADPTARFQPFGQTRPTVSCRRPVNKRVSKMKVKSRPRRAAFAGGGLSEPASFLPLASLSADEVHDPNLDMCGFLFIYLFFFSLKDLETDRQSDWRLSVGHKGGGSPSGDADEQIYWQGISLIGLAAPQAAALRGGEIMPF